ncbi:nestin [Saimiri boliviensis]|uniref:nestin n=1 Tax=Saimiri boliviensis TaxID=27679 RepID=UPI003D76EB0D
MEGCMGEESFQMWELNRRLEAYLARVKALEEQNELLSAELGGLRAQSGDTSWRARANDELAALRALVDQRWREKHAAEVARDNLAEELEGVAGRCQQLRLAREQTAEEVARNRRAVEAEKCAQAWLSSQAAELERELEALRLAHEEERVGLNAQAACTPRCPAPPRGPSAPAPEVEELARRLGEAWRGAVRGYQERVAHMETSLGQARERLGRAVQGAREGRLELQQLQAERGGLQERRAALEQRLESRWQERLRATEKFQLAVEALEQEKQGLQSQIAQVLEGRQQLAHLKMSLSLEVATYRTLLEAENSRLQTPGGGSKTPLSFQDPKLELQFPGTPEGRHLGSLLPVLSPTSLPSPLPATLETPVPAFLKNRELLQARTPALASTPIPPTPQAPSPAADAEIRAQDAPLSLLQTQGGRQRAAEPLQAEAKVAIPASILPGAQEPVGKRQGAGTGQSPEDHASLAPALSPDHSSLEAKDGETARSRVFSVCQEEGEGQSWGLEEKETAIEGKVVGSLQQEVCEEEGMDRKESQDSQVPVEKETLTSLGEEIQDSLKTLENQSHETLERENQESPRALEDLETLKSLEKENKEPLKEIEVVRPLEKEGVGLLKPAGKEHTPASQSLPKENPELMKSLEGNLETILSPGKENQELVSSLQENLESSTALEKEDQEPLRPPAVEDEEALRPLTKENRELPRSLEDENQEALRPLEKENQELPKTPEEEDQSMVRPLETENHESLRSVEEEDQEALRILEKETQQPRKSLGEEDQMTLRPPEKGDPEPLQSLEKDQEIARPLENENQELLKSLKEERVEAVKSLEIELLESLKSAEENLATLTSPGTQVPLWSLEEINHGTMIPPEKEIPEPLGSVEVNQETWRLPEEENQEPLRSLGAWNLENLRSPEEIGKESRSNLAAEESLGENRESLRSLEEEGRELPPSADAQSGGDTVAKDPELAQESPPGMAGGENKDEAEQNPREQDGFAGKEEVVEQGELNATGEAWVPGEGHPGSPEPKEHRGAAEGASGKGGAEGLQDPEGQPQQVGTPGLQAPQELPEAIEPLVEGEDVAPRGDQASPEVMLGSEPAVGESAAGAEAVPGQEEGRLEGPGHLTRGEVMEPPLEEESLEAKRVQGLEGPRKDIGEADALGTELSELPGESGDPLEPPKGWEEPEAEAPLGAEEAFPAETLGHNGSDAPPPRPPGSEEAEEAASPVLAPPSPMYTPILEDAPGSQPQAEGSQGASWGLEGRSEALGNVESEHEELASGEIPEGLQEEEEQSREESEEDELGETLPDSTPLGLYLRSPTSPKWDPAGEQSPPHQGETGKEGWDPAVLVSQGLEALPSAEEEGEEGEEERGRDSDLSEEFEDLGTEASLLPGVPGEVAEPLGQVPQLLLEPAVWDRDGESDGFADEEESGEEGGEEGEEEGGEEGEEGREPGAGRWGPGSSVGSLQALRSSQRGDFMESDSLGADVPWDDGSRGAVAGAPMTALETESQESAEASGSEEESDPVSLEREDKEPGPLEIPSGAEDAGPGADTVAVNGQGPSLEPSQRVNGGVMNGLEQSEDVGQGTPLVPEGDRGSPFQEEEGSALKTPWAGAPVHLGSGPFLKFTQREGDRESWSSGED